jgi:hypothetical protein
MQTATGNDEGGLFMSFTALVVVVLLLLLIGALPAWPYGSWWGYCPSGGVGLALLETLALFFTGSLS